MLHPWPKEIAVTFCTACSLLTFADHVNRLDEIPHRFCSHCAKPLEVSIYALDRPVHPILVKEKKGAKVSK